MSEWRGREKENRKTINNAYFGGRQESGIRVISTFVSELFCIFQNYYTKPLLCITCLYEKQTGSFPLQIRSNLISLVWHTTPFTFPTFPLPLEQAYTHPFTHTLLCPRWLFHLRNSYFQDQSKAPFPS